MADALIIIGILGLLVIVLGLALWATTVSNATLQRRLELFSAFDPDHDGKPGGRVLWSAKHGSINSDG